MTDERLRTAERRWKESGSLDDEAAYLTERIRLGESSIELFNDVRDAFLRQPSHEGLRDYILGLYKRTSLAPPSIKNMKDNEVFSFIKALSLSDPYEDLFILLHHSTPTEILFEGSLEDAGKYIGQLKNNPDFEVQYHQPRRYSATVSVKVGDNQLLLMFNCPDESIEAEIVLEELLRN